jgi:hypothetical protein
LSRRIILTLIKDILCKFSGSDCGLIICDCVVSLENNNVSKEWTAFVFRVDSTLKMETACPSERFVSICRTRQCNRGEKEATYYSENLVSVYKCTRHHNLRDHMPNYTLITTASEFGASTEVVQRQFKRLRMYAQNR